MTLLVAGSCFACIFAGVYVLATIIREFDRLRNRE
jgi:hypothetical protein